MGQRHGDMGVEQVHGRVELEEGQREHRGRGHAVGQQPEEQVLVTEEAVAREGIGGRQCDADRDHRVDADVDQRVDVAVVPGRVGEDRLVVVQREFLREQAECPEDLVGGLERHVQQPVDRQHQEQDVDKRDEPFEVCGALGGHQFFSPRVITV